MTVNSQTSSREKSRVREVTFQESFFFLPSFLPQDLPHYVPHHEMPSARKKEGLASSAAASGSFAKRTSSDMAAISSSAKSKQRAGSSSKESEKQIQEHTSRFREEALVCLTSAYESIQNKRKRTSGEGRGAIRAQIDALRGGLAASAAKTESLATTSDSLATALAAALRQVAEEGQRLKKSGRSPELDGVASKVREELKRDMAKALAKAEADDK